MNLLGLGNVLLPISLFTTKIQSNNYIRRQFSSATTGIKDFNMMKGNNEFIKNQYNRECNYTEPIGKAPHTQIQKNSSCFDHTSSSFASAMSSFSSGNDEHYKFNEIVRSNCIWNGSLIARIIPKDFEEYECRKPACKTNPTPLLNQLSMMRRHKRIKDDLSRQSTLGMNFIKSNYSANSTDSKENESIISLDLTISCNPSDNTFKEYIAVQVHMNRKSSETLGQTLRRLEISTSKKIEKELQQFYSLHHHRYLDNDDSGGSMKSNNWNKKKRNSKNDMDGEKLSSYLFYIHDGESDSKSRDQHRYLQENLDPTIDSGKVWETVAAYSNQNGAKVALSLFNPYAKAQAKYFPSCGIGEKIDTISSKDGYDSNISPPSEIINDVIANPPTILSIKTFENFAGKLYTNVPVAIEMDLIFSSYAFVSWFLDDKLVFEDSTFFIPTEEDVGKTLKVLIIPQKKQSKEQVDETFINDDPKVLLFEEAYEFKNKIEQLPRMPILTPLRSKWVSKRALDEKQNQVRVLTYNILADLYAAREMDQNIMFSHCKSEYLSKTRRMPMIIAEILAYSADVICLQEVDGSIYDTYLRPVLNAMNYDGYYSNKDSLQREGCALFWSKDSFDVETLEDLQSYSIRDLFQHEKDVEREQQEREDYKRNQVKRGLEHWESMDDINNLLHNHDELRRVALEKIGQIVQIAKLRLKKPKGCDDKPRKIIIANTHLFYHPMADHIRALQAFAVCRKLDEVRRVKIEKYPYPLILCGDLNSDPLSGAAQLLFTRTLLPEHRDCWKFLHEYKWEMGDKEYMTEHGYVGNEPGVTELAYEEEAFKTARESFDSNNNSKCIPPSISLPNCFPNLISGCSEIPVFTNYAVDFVETLDYILASEPSTIEPYGFALVKSAPMPTAEDVQKFIAMPNEFMPSDHVSLVCDLEWRTNKGSK